MKEVIPFVNLYNINIDGKDISIDDLCIYKDSFLAISNNYIYISKDLIEWTLFYKIEYEKEHEVDNFIIKCIYDIIVIYCNFNVWMSYDGNTWKLIKFNNLKSDIVNNSNYKNKEISEAIPFVPLGRTYSIISFKDYFNDIIYNDRFIIICASCSCNKLINKGFIFKRKEPISFNEVILFIYNIATKQWNTVRIFDIFPFNRIKKIKKIIESGGYFYILTENKLLKSSNGVDWNEINIFNINIVRDIYNSKYGILISVPNNDYYMRYHNIYRLLHNNTNDIDYEIIPKEIIHNFSKFIYIKTSDTYIAFYDIKSSGCYHEQSLALSNNLKNWIKININSKNMSSNSHFPISLYTIKRIIFFNKTVFILFDQDNENIYSIKLLNKQTYSINLNKN